MTTHELFKLDGFLGVPLGTSYNVLVQHVGPERLNEKLLAHGIILDSYGMVPKDQRQQWRELLQRVGVSSAYWRCAELLHEEKVEITDL